MKKRAGRPPKRNPLEERLVVKVTPAFKARVAAAAERVNADDVSAWVRVVLAAAADKLLGPETKAE